MSKPARISDTRTGYVDGKFNYLGRTADQWLPEAISAIVRNFAPLKIILFGSRARGEQGADSDIDLLIVLSEVKNKRAQTAKMLVALADVPAPVDIILTDLDEISRRGELVGTVLWPALHEGKILYERSA